MAEEPEQKFSPKALQLRDSLTAIRIDAESLLWHLGRFPTHETESVDDKELQIILDLTQDIGTNINKIRKIMRDGKASNMSSPRHSIYKHSNNQERKQYKKKLLQSQHTEKMGSAKLQCNICATEDTPKWRSGPAGPGSLCNVCGLVFAKRQDKLESRSLYTAG